MSAAKNPRAWWLIGLLILALVPTVAGVGRLAALAGAGDPTPENARFFAAPLPVVLHIVAASLFAVLGAFQFAPKLRRRTSGWHRRVGALLVVCGFVVALSGLWMTIVYPNAEGDGAALYLLRLVFGGGMLASMIMASRAIGRRDFAAHGAWMTRAYAIAMGAGTQVVTHLPYFLFVGKPGEGVRAVLMGAGWVLNVAVAEWWIRSRLMADKGGDELRPSAATQA